MILPFSTQINKKPSYFVEKILRGIINEHAGKVTGIADDIYNSGESLNYQDVDEIFDEIEHKVKPKLHTIREDKKNRWKVGTKIDFFINARQKNMFRFAPVLPVVSLQKVEIEITKNAGILKRQVFIDDIFQIYYEYDDRIIDKGMLEFVQNDGFETIEDFFTFFNKDYTGKLIHWTDKKY